MVPRPGLEPGTYALSRRCYYQLSYRGYKYCMEDVYDEYRVLYKFSKQPYQQRMFNCLPAEFVLDAQPPQHRDFQETDLERTTPPLPGVED